MKTIKFRASQCGKLMVNPKNKADKEAGLLGETAKSYVEEIFLFNEFRYNEIICTDEMLKGQICQQDAFDVAQKVLGGSELRKENKQIFENEFLTGRPDIILSDCIEDTKCSWSPKTFMNAELTDLYKYQGTAYMALTGRKHFRLIYVLVNTPTELVEEQKKRIYFKFNYDEDNPYYKEMSEQIERNHNFDHIPISKRIKIFEFDFSESDYKLLENKCKKAIEYYNTLSL